MGLLEQEIKEIRLLIKEFQAGKIDAEHLHELIGAYSQTEKRTRLMLQAFTLFATGGGVGLSRLIRANLIGDGTAIDDKFITDEEQENEKVSCTGNDQLISRHECLDFSGSIKFPECEACETGIITKRILLPKC